MLEHEARPEHWAAEAERLLKDATLLRAVAAIKARALDDLMRCDPSKTGEIYRFQAQARCAETFMQALHEMIVAVNDGYDDPLE